MGWCKSQISKNPAKEAAIEYRDRHRFCWFFMRSEPAELIEDRGYGAIFEFANGQKTFIHGWRGEIKAYRIAPISREEWERYLDSRKNRPLLPPPILKNPPEPEAVEPASIKQRLAGALAGLKKSKAEKEKEKPKAAPPDPAGYTDRIKEIVASLRSGENPKAATSSRRKKPNLATATVSDEVPAVDRQELAAAIDWLFSQGLPPIPFAPAFPAEEYPAKRYGKIIRDADGNPKPKFNGKNPSYLDKFGRPHIISHRRFNSGAMPTAADILKWWENSKTGIGTLAKSRTGIYFLDLDAKHFDATDGGVDAVAEAIAAKYGEDGLIERTRSGGYRFAFRSTEKMPGKFYLADQHCGEILQGGQPVVLAPAANYENLRRTRQLPIFNSLQDLGLEDRPPKKERCKESDPFVRFPAYFWKAYKHACYPWLLARFKDKAGKGSAQFSINEAAEFFNRRPSTIERWVKMAVKSGLCRGLQRVGDQIKFFYSSVHKAAAKAGLPNLGPCGLVDFCKEEERQNLAILSTEFIQSDRQRRSRWAAQKENPEEKLPNPFDFFHSCEKTMARELWKNKEAIGFSEGATLYGAELDAVADEANLCRRQVQRHLSALYRKSSASVKKYRGTDGLPELDRAQIHQRLSYRAKPSIISAATEFGEAGKFWVDAEGRVWERKCLIFAPRSPLIRWRFRRSRVFVFEP